MAKKYVYYFGDGKAEGTGEHEGTAGRQGRRPGRDDQSRHFGSSGLHDLRRKPASSTTSSGKAYPPGMWMQALQALKRVERSMNAGFGDPDNPLLVSVRSGARASMPGMMDTVLNVGLNHQDRRTGLPQDQERAVCAGQLPPVHGDVRQHCDGRQSRAFRGYPQTQESGILE